MEVYSSVEIQTQARQLTDACTYVLATLKAHQYGEGLSLLNDDPHKSGCTVQIARTFYVRLTVGHSIRALKGLDSECEMSNHKIISKFKQQ